MSDNKTIIIDAIKKGLGQAVMEAFWFSGKVDEKVKVEYLITVNVAKEIGSKNNAHGYPYKISLEEKTKDFTASLFPYLKRDKNTTTIRNSDNLDTYRSGKIDIAVYLESRNEIHNWDHKIPFCAIEVKGFNPTKQQVMPDLKRDTEYFFKKANTGFAPCIELSAFVCLESQKKYKESKDKENGLKRVREKYEKFLRCNTFGYDLEHSLDVFSVSDISTDNCNPDDDMDDTSCYFHHFMGVIIIFKKTEGKR